MAPCDAQAEIRRLTQENEALRAHNTGLTEQLAKELQTSALLRRAVEWCLSNGVHHQYAQQNWNDETARYDYAWELQVESGNDVPAEFADIIKPAAGGDGNG